MAPVPKKKTTRSKSDQRRKSSQKFDVTLLKARYAKVKGIIKRLEEQKTSAS